MRDPREQVLAWTVDVEDDLADPDRLHVFVPSIMGAGLLVSLAILVGDLRRAVAGSGGSRQRLRTRRAARALVVPMAGAVGVELPPVRPPRRRLRSRAFYVITFVVEVTLALYVAIGSTLNYVREDGYLEGVHWVQAVALLSSAFFLAVGVSTLVIAWCYPSVPRALRAVIDRSPLGAQER